MFAQDQYELLDAGEGRRLERFGPMMLDRPAPAAAEMVRQLPGLWKKADARFQRGGAAHGDWLPLRRADQIWQVRHGTSVFQLRCTGSGAVGLFAEQAPNWDWVEQQVRRATRPLKILNLFAYTGGSTMAAAAAGATELVHVDAARSVVKWARRNAELSDLTAAPVRWIVEDARKFVDREVRRGAGYDAVILDPPTYGHGPKSQPWILVQHLDDLLDALGDLTRDRLAFILLTCHTPGVGPRELKAMLTRHLLKQQWDAIQAGSLSLQTRDGRTLESGVAARWSAVG